MAEIPYDPLKDQAEVLALEAYNHRHTPGGRAMLELLHHRLEAVKTALLFAGYGKQNGEDDFRNYQGQAHAIKSLIDDIEEGSALLLAQQAELSTEETT